MAIQPNNGPQTPDPDCATQKSYTINGSSPPNTACEKECTKRNNNGGFDYHPQTNYPGVYV